jgi:hypothetical protein
MLRPNLGVLTDSRILSTSPISSGRNRPPFFGTSLPPGVKPIAPATALVLPSVGALKACGVLAVVITSLMAGWVSSRLVFSGGICVVAAERGGWGDR